MGYGLTSEGLTLGENSPASTQGSNAEHLATAVLVGT